MADRLDREGEIRWEMTVEDLANPATVSEILEEIRSDASGGHPQIETVAEFAVFMTNTDDILEEWDEGATGPHHNDLNTTFVPLEISIADDLSKLAVGVLINSARYYIETRKEDSQPTEESLVEFETVMMSNFQALISKAHQLENIIKERHGLTAGLFTNN